ncbi:MAG TPA: dienelactone hydrolase family protein [Candidatus Binatia bacterium]|nr:dienelactone hydrolase family protein [Candidatus Binatia bacterium]
MHAEEHAFGFLAHPDGPPVPGVVLIPDVWGLSDHYRELARRLAREGFAVIAIDPYRRTGKGEFSDPPGALAWIRRLPDPVVLATVQEAIDALAAHPAVAGRKIGVTGLCMGGQYALLAACSCRGVSACAPFYGMVGYDAGLDRALKPRSPLDALVDLRCPVLGLYGAEDPIIPPADVEELRTRLAQTGQPFDVRIYPNAGHAFMNETRPAMYRKDAAADAWPRLVAFLRERLA